jgi:hypothetical protein
MELAKTENAGRWKPGQSGNLSGKPVGARHRFSAAFLEDLAEVWTEHGRAAMLACAKQGQRTFFAVCARLIPADVKLTVEQSYGALSPEHMAVLEAIRAEVPDANNQAPQAVLEYVKEAVRAHAATKLKSTVRKMWSSTDS